MIVEPWPQPNYWYPYLPSPSVGEIPAPAVGWRCPNCGRGLSPTTSSCNCRSVYGGPGTIMGGYPPNPLPALDLTVWNNTGDSSYLGNVGKGYVDNFAPVDTQQDITDAYYSPKQPLTVQVTPANPGTIQS